MEEKKLVVGSDVVSASVMNAIIKEMQRPACRKCGGFMVSEYPQLSFGDNMAERGVLYGIRRCISCGAVLDPTIIKNRVAPPKLPDSRPRMTKQRGG